MSLHTSERNRFSHEPRHFRTLHEERWIWWMRFLNCVICIIFLNCNVSHAYFRTGKRCFYANLDCMQLTREDVHNFGLRCKELGIQYVGLCCGNSAHYTRALSESLGKKPPASRYTVNMHDHYLLGKSDKICDRYSEEKDVHACVAGKVSTD